MININRHNYEEIFIDYLDGSLDFHDVAELMLFLSDNPELDAELQGLQDINIDKKRDSLPIKNLLKKDEDSISGSVIDDKCIAKLEGDLNKEELKKFNSQLFNDEKLRNNLLLVLKTKLKKDKSIIYPFSEELKKQNDRSIFVKGVFRYAAVFIPAIIFSVLYINSSNQNNDTSSNNTYVANNTEKITSDKPVSKKTENNSFKIIKIETPSIVSQSVNLVKTKKLEHIIDQEIGNRSEEDQENSVDIIEPIIENESFAIFSKDANTTTNAQKENVNTHFNTYDVASNEIKSDEYISKLMEQYKIEEKTEQKDNSTFGESIAETFSDLTNVFQFNKQTVDDGKVYRLAFNSKNFEIGRIKKKEK